jgi:hypothetical protein
MCGKYKDARFLACVANKGVSAERGRRAGDCSEVEAEKSWGATFACHDSLKRVRYQYLHLSERQIDRGLRAAGRRVVEKKMGCASVVRTEGCEKTNGERCLG